MTQTNIEVDVNFLVNRNIWELYITSRLYRVLFFIVHFVCSSTVVWRNAARICHFLYLSDLLVWSYISALWRYTETLKCDVIINWLYWGLYIFISMATIVELVVLYQDKIHIYGWNCTVEINWLKLLVLLYIYLPFRQTLSYFEKTHINVA